MERSGKGISHNVQWLASLFANMFSLSVGRPQEYSGLETPDLPAFTVTSRLQCRRSRGQRCYGCERVNFFVEIFSAGLCFMKRLA